MSQLPQLDYKLLLSLGNESCVKLVASLINLMCDCRFLYAECSPGADRHSDDGVYGGDSEYGQGGGVHAAVFYGLR